MGQAAPVADDPNNLRNLISNALRKYVHCSKKQFRGAALSEEECADLYSSRLLVPIWEELKGDVNIQLHRLGYSDPEFDLDNGWVRITVGERSLYYPFTLAMHPPPAEVLKDLAEAAQSYRMYENSLICLSGSAPLGGVVSTIGDLDLFEYVEPETVESALQQKEPKYREENVVCLKTKIATTNESWPDDFPVTSNSSKIHHNKMRRYAAKYLDNFNFCKIDMVGEFGPLWGEVTNIIYKSSSRNANDGFPTHTFQEITVDREPLENAGSLKNFGKYCYFLRDFIESVGNQLAYAKQHPDTKAAVDDRLNFDAVKAAKRAINLCSVLSLDSESFAVVANSDVGKRYVASQLLTTLTGMISNSSTSSNAKSAKKAISKILNDLDDSSDDPNIFDIREISASLLGLVTEMDLMCFPSSVDLEGVFDEEA